MVCDGIQSPYEFRRTTDDGWERRSTSGGRWFRLHVELVERVTSVHSTSRGLRQVRLAPERIWTWR